MRRTLIIGKGRLSLYAKLLGSHINKLSLGTDRRSLGDNIRMDVKELRCKGDESMHVVQDRV